MQRTLVRTDHDRREQPLEGNPDTILGAPIAFHFGLGEAF